MIRAAIYTRVSTQEQAKEGYSIGEQIERLTNYCAAMGWEIVGTYTDAGFSGGNTDRPGLQKLCEDVLAGKINKVAVYKLDRLSRSQLDTLYLIEKVFIANNTDFVSMSENFDTSTPFGKAMIGILAVFAQLEREQIKERLMMGKEAKIKDGYWIGSVAPMGYSYMDGKLVINEEEAEQVREMFSLFAQGTALRDIETRFAEKGYLLRGRPWRLFSIRYMLDNKVYAGYLRCGEKWVKGNHDPIIGEDLWITAHDRMEENRQRFASLNLQTNGDRHSTILGGMIYCRQCGARYGKRQEGYKPNKYYTYCCYSRMKVARQMVKDPDCKNKTYRVESLDEIIIGKILDLAIHPMLIEKESKHNADKKDREKEKASIDRRLKTVENQISRFLDLYGLGRISIDQLDEKMAPLEDQRKKLQAQLTIADDTSISVDTARKIITEFPEVAERGDRKEIRTMIEALIDRIDIDNDDIYIQWRF